MRTVPFSGRSLLALVFAGSSLLAACGAEQGASSALDPASDASLHALVAGVPYVETGAGDAGDEADDGDDAPSAQCDKLMAKVQKDGLAMQRTKEFRALAKTQEFKQMQKTVQALQEAGCSLSGQGGTGSLECLQLKLQAYRDQQAMMATAEFKALQKTKQFKALMKSAQAAQKAGCLDEESSANGLMVIL